MPAYYCRMTKYLLIMSNATYSIDMQTAALLRKEMMNGEKQMVLIGLDLFGEGKLARVSLAIRHIIAVAEYDAGNGSISQNLPEGVVFLAPR